MREATAGGQDIPGAVTGAEDRYVDLAIAIEVAVLEWDIAGEAVLPGPSTREITVRLADIPGAIRRPVDHHVRAVIAGVITAQTRRHQKAVFEHLDTGPTGTSLRPRCPAERNGPTSVFCHRSSIQLASVCRVGSLAGGLAGAAARQGEVTMGITNDHIAMTNDQ